MKNKHGVTQQQEKFCQAIVAGKSQSDAYRAAYRVRPGTKASTVHVEACTLAARPKVAQRIAALSAAVEEKFTIKTVDLLRESYRLATSDVSKIMGPDGKVLLPNELDVDTRRAVASFEIDDLGRIKYRFWDKNSAHERLFKHKGLFEKDNGQKTTPLTELLASLHGKVMRPAAAAALWDDTREDGEDG